MITTLIDQNNISYFEDVLAQWRDLNDPDMLYIGVMDDEKNAVGALAALEYGGRLCIKHVGVDEDHVRSGYGSWLLSECVRVAKSAGEIVVFAELPISEDATENEKALMSFFEKNGFEMIDTGARKKIYDISELLNRPFVSKEEIPSKGYDELNDEEKEIVASFSWMPRFEGSFDNMSRFIFKDGELTSAALIRSSYDEIALEMIVGANISQLGSIFEHSKRELQKRLERGDLSEHAVLKIDYLEERFESFADRAFSMKPTKGYRVMMAEKKL